ncbi:hypothetical protein [Streptomyces nitrosporeus]|uniref:aldose epimerase family protein n=1 Tax=Streptomyces nitrosporeus TaxID=28894 RepID=UPI003320263F
MTGHPQEPAGGPARQRTPPRRRTGRPGRRPGTGPGERRAFGLPGQARAEVHRLGARPHSLLLPGRWGHFAETVSGARDAAQARGPGGCSGAAAGRVAGGRLPVDGAVHQLDTQADGHALHGGPEGPGQRLWNCGPFHSAARTGVRL